MSTFISYTSETLEELGLGYFEDDPQDNNENFHFFVKNLPGAIFDEVQGLESDLHFPIPGIMVFDDYDVFVIAPGTIESLGELWGRYKEWCLAHPEIEGDKEIQTEEVEQHGWKKWRSARIDRFLRERTLEEEVR